jgi:hypothetical protein
MVDVIPQFSDITPTIGRYWEGFFRPMHINMLQEFLNWKPSHQQANQAQSIYNSYLK